MSFVFTDAHHEEFHGLGYTVFRGILPPSLVADLRRVADRARELARERHGPQAQRLQPLARYGLDGKEVQALRELPALSAAVTRLLGPGCTYANAEALGVLLEPAELPWCTHWHRDGRDNQPYLSLSTWESAFHDPGVFNQVNCALYRGPQPLGGPRQPPATAGP